MPVLILGILTFFLLEKLVLWRHCHDAHECEVHTSSAASLVIVGDAFHTFVDGAVIAAAVVTSLPLGITTALAVATHEIPQEVGDVAILLRAGYSRMRAFTLNLLAGLGGILGAVAMIFATDALPHALPVRAVVRRRQLPLRGDGRSHPRPAPRRAPRWADPPVAAHRRRHLHDRAALARPLKSPRPEVGWRMPSESTRPCLCHPPSGYLCRLSTRVGARRDSTVTISKTGRFSHFLAGTTFAIW